MQCECSPNDADGLHVDRCNRYCVTKIWNVSQLGAPLRSWVSVRKNLVVAIDPGKDRCVRNHIHKHCLPASINPRLQVWSLGANGGIEAVSRQHNGVGRKRKKFVVD